jgi:hypothetical protein
VSSITASHIVAGDRELALEYRAASRTSLVTPINVTSSHKLPRAIAISQTYNLDAVYQQLSHQWGNQFRTDDFNPTPEQVVAYRTNVYLGAYLPPFWRRELPDTAISIISGEIQNTAARCAIILRRTTITQLQLVSAGSPVANINNTHLVESYTSPVLGLTVFNLHLTKLLPDTRYEVKIYHSPTVSPIAEQSQWSFRTLPSWLPSTGFSFLATSCYCDFQISGEPDAGLRNLFSITSFLSGPVGAFFKPSFRALMGDNLYLDVAPDTYKTSGMIDPIADTVGRYLRYFLVSPYARSLELLPNFAIPDDHEYWNDYPREQPHLLQRTSRTSQHRSRYAEAAKRFLHAFQGALTRTDMWCIPGTEAQVCDTGIGLWRGYNPGEAVTDHERGRVIRTALLKLQRSPPSLPQQPKRNTYET